MHESVVGIFDHFGVSCLHSEDAHTVFFLKRRADRNRVLQAWCFWAVLPIEAHTEIQQQLACGNRDNATELLARFAIDGGSIMLK